jgi:hypothetical protein
VTFLSIAHHFYDELHKNFEACNKKWLPKPQSCSRNKNKCQKYIIRNMQNCIEGFGLTKSVLVAVQNKI